MQRNQREKILTELAKIDPTGFALLHSDNISADWSIQFNADYQTWNFMTVNHPFPGSGFYFGDTEEEAIDFMNELLNR